MSASAAATDAPAVPPAAPRGGSLSLSTLSDAENPTDSTFLELRGDAKAVRKTSQPVQHVVAWPSACRDAGSDGGAGGAFTSSAEPASALSVAAWEQGLGEKVPGSAAVEAGRTVIVTPIAVDAAVGAVPEGGAAGKVSVQAAFAGATVLLTGVTGFVASLVLEQLLRSCLDISAVYVTIRSRFGLTPQVIQKMTCLSAHESTCPNSINSCMPSQVAVTEVLMPT